MSCKNLSVLGSTGSVGVQTLQVAGELNLPVSAMSANRNIDLFEKQIRKFRPKLAAVYDLDKAAELKERIKDTTTRVVAGMDGLCEAAAFSEADTVLTAVSGMVGFLPTLEAIRAGKAIALANKETLIAGGEIVTAEIKKKKLPLYPVDSEHSAIFQSLLGCRERKEIKKLIVTASGGPFFGKTREELTDIQPKDALKHPNWSMGSKITIDSATLVNKGLEVMEAMWLFDVPLSKIEVVVHRESIIHSMVEYIDNAVIAQLGCPDMRTPIQFALTYPERKPCSSPSLDFYKLSSLTFSKPDTKTFGAFECCLEAAQIGGTMPAAVNAANEAAVALFLEGKIGFLMIEEILRETLCTHKSVYHPSVQDILKTDADIRSAVLARKESL